MTARCSTCGFSHPDAFSAAKCENAARLGKKLNVSLERDLRVVEPETIEEAVIGELPEDGR